MALSCIFAVCRELNPINILQPVIQIFFPSVGHTSYILPAFLPIHNLRTCEIAKLCCRTIQRRILLRSERHGAAGAQLLPDIQRSILNKKQQLRCRKGLYTLQMPARTTVFRKNTAHAHINMIALSCILCTYRLRPTDGA